MKKLKITSLNEALRLIPTHILLIPGIDKRREGDEYAYPFKTGNAPGVAVRWLAIDSRYYGEVYTNIHDEKSMFRRKIPKKVRENMAWWLLYEAVASVYPDKHGTVYCFNFERKRFDLLHGGGSFKLARGISYQGQEGATGIKKMKTVRDAIKMEEVLGGLKMIEKRLREGHLFYRWRAT